MNWFNKISSDIWYHQTRPEFLNNILEKGILLNQKSNFTIGAKDFWGDHYSVWPIFLSKNIYSENDERNTLILSVDVSGLPLVADLPSLVDGAKYRDVYLDDNYLSFWDCQSIPSCFSLDCDEENGYDIQISHLLNPNDQDVLCLIKEMGTCACMSNIDTSRIINYKVV